MAVVVSDTSPVWALSYLRRLDLLRGLFGEVLIPPAVVRELQSPHTGVHVKELLSLPFVRVQLPQNAGRVQEFRVSLDPGESEALALALETEASAILIDESAGRAIAKRLGLKSIGVLGVLLRGKELGLIDQVRQPMDRLRIEINFFISSKLREDVLRRAGEWPERRHDAVPES